MKTIFYILSLSIISMIGCRTGETQPAENNNKQNQNGKIVISGAFALMPLVEKWALEYNKIHPQVGFELNAVGSGEAVENISNSGLVMVSSELSRELDSMLWVIPVARLSTVLIVNKNNPYWIAIWENGLTMNNLAEIFTGGITHWGDFFDDAGHSPVSVYIRSDKAGTSDILAKYLWLQTDEIKGIGKEGEDKLFEAVGNDPLAIGYCNFIKTFDPATKEFDENVAIIPIDINQNCIIDPKENFYNNFTELQRAMWLGKYPCVLNRTLKFVAFEKPSSPAITDFLKWIYTEGQKYVPEMGYMELRSSEIKQCLYYL